jgi:transposase
VLDEAARHTRWGRVLADAAYDAERHHAQCRDDFRIRTTAIPINRRGGGRKWPRTKYRRQMRRRFPKIKYRQRWQVESAFSRHKRLLGEALRARSDAARERECYLRVITHNIMLLAARE